MKKLLPLFWLFLIPIQVVIGFLFVRLGALIDMAIFSRSGSEGHGIPIFSFVFLIIAALVTIIVFIAAIVLTVRGFIKNNTNIKKIGNAAEGIRYFETINLKISGMRGTREYEIICKGEETEISFYRFFYSDGKEERRLEKSVLVNTEKMIEILNSCNFAGWNGFNGEHPKNVSDGEMFRLEAVIGENKTIKAEGSANFPKGYGEFLNRISSALE